MSQSKRDKLKAQVMSNIQREGFAFEALIGPLSKDVGTGKETDGSGEKKEEARQDTWEERVRGGGIPSQSRKAKEPEEKAEAVSAAPKKEKATPEKTTIVKSTTVKNTIAEPTTVIPTTVNSTTVEITSNRGFLDLDVSDRLAPLQTPAEQAIYNRLYRLSYGEGRDTCTVGLTRLTQSTGIKSPKTVAAALRNLVTKRHIAVVDGHHNNPKGGTTYRVFLPGEIEGIRSKTKVKRTPA